MRFYRPFIAALTALGLVACGGTSSTPPETSVALPAVDTMAVERLLSSEETLEVLSFPTVGRMTQVGEIVGYASAAYAVPVAAGQKLLVTLESPSSNAYFNVQDAADSSGAAVFRGEVEGREARIQAESDAAYVIRPFQPRAMARRDEVAPYSLTIERQ
ncbi:hypothetical protein G3480_12780 [Thiorhodococcus mannitoliphagus]|uniref:Uncharacterized protein n=1 Tax=Thiorhodococcus mannitoliphagus TaxID=329406 RepID=A0A6P1DSU8_9GAMM|nr:hypothetical protein [Thiorhodococcus mannitoliphagus]NEX21178.1 hypothetical protein [Thiorhodococcus mannitoliphagus]